MGRELARSLRAGDVVLLEGELGMGKTCFARGLAIRSREPHRGRRRGGPLLSAPGRLGADVVFEVLQLLVDWHPRQRRIHRGHRLGLDLAGDLRLEIAEERALELGAGRTQRGRGRLGVGSVEERGLLLRRLLL